MIRDNYIRIRLTTSELEYIKQQAKNQNVTASDYIRHLALGPESVKKMPSADKIIQLRTEISRIGNNINQAVKSIHEAKKADILTKNQFNYLNNNIEETIKMKNSLEKKLLKALGI